MQPLISVIVPVYNKEKYIVNCIESIINQTYKNLEIIIIDDGSLDSSLRLCLEYAKIDNRIKIICQDNAGPSVARNKGIDNAHGEYIAFVDADDRLESIAYETMLNNLLMSNTQMALIGMKYIFRNGSKDIKLPGKDKCALEKKDFLRLFFENNIMCFSSVNKLYPKKIIGNTRFDTSIKMSEDQKFIYEIIKKVDCIIYDPQICYYINFTDCSLSRTIPTRYHLSQLDVCEYIYNEVQDEEIKNKAKIYMTDLCLTGFVPYYDNNFMSQDIERVNSIINQNILIVLLYGNIKTKVKLGLYIISPKLLKYVLLKKKKLEKNTL